MAIGEVGTALIFTAFFTKSKLGVASLTVTIDVYDETNTLIVTAGSATEVGGGLYQYSLASGSVDAAGIYRAIFKTTGDVDVKNVPSQWNVLVANSSTPTLGSGSTAYTIAIHDELANDIVGAEVWITSDVAGTSVIAGTLITNDNGEVTFMLDPGTTVYVWTDSARANFSNPYTWVIPA